MLAGDQHRMRANLLHVVTTISNPARYASRYALYERFVEQMFRAGVELTTVELTYGERRSGVSEILDRLADLYGRGKERRHIRLHSRSELWHKENLIDIGMASLPEDARYLAWIDADITFQRPDWAVETVERLQQADIVQLFSHAVDLAPDHQLAPPYRHATSFLCAHLHSLPSSSGRYDDHNWHPGYAWAITRDAYRALGGLMDFAILGAADRHMAMALIGKAELSLPRGITNGYRQRVMAWQDLAEEHVRGNIGYVPGLITHGWHGRKRQRGYHDRWQILVRNQYDPTTDIKYEPTTGLIEWSHARSGRLRNLRDDVRRYFRSRNEDSIDLE